MQRRRNRHGVNIFALAALAALIGTSDRTVLAPSVRPLRLVAPLTTTGCQCHQKSSQERDDGADGSGTAQGKDDILGTSIVTSNSPLTYSLTVRFRRLAALRLERPILITTKAAYTKIICLCTSNSNIIQMIWHWWWRWRRLCIKKAH